MIGPWAGRGNAQRERGFYNGLPTFQDAWRETTFRCSFYIPEFLFWFSNIVSDPWIPDTKLWSSHDKIYSWKWWICPGNLSGEWTTADFKMFMVICCWPKVFTLLNKQAFLGHTIRYQCRIPTTTLSLMASTKKNRAVSWKCCYQVLMWKLRLPSTWLHPSL